MHYHRIPVQDVRRSAAFYGDLLGVPPMHHVKGDYAEVEAADILLALYGPEFEAYDRRTPELDRPQLTIQLPPISSHHLQEVLVKHGLDHRDATTTIDPDGHLLSIPPSHSTLQAPHAQQPWPESDRSISRTHPSPPRLHERTHRPQ